MVKEKNNNRVEAGKRSAMKNKWIQEIKKLSKKNKIPYKEAMSVASVNKKNKIDKKEVKKEVKKKDLVNSS